MVDELRRQSFDLEGSILCILDQVAPFCAYEALHGSENLRSFGPCYLLQSTLRGLLGAQRTIPAQLNVVPRPSPSSGVAGPCPVGVPCRLCEG